MLTGDPIAFPSTKESSSPSRGSQRIRGLRLMPRSTPVWCNAVNPPLSASSLTQNFPTGYFTTGHRMTEDELKSVQGRIWEE